MRPSQTMTAIRTIACAALSLGAVGIAGCRDLAGTDTLPSGTPDPKSVNTPAGAMGMRNSAVLSVETALPSYLIRSGLLTDELTSNTTGGSSYSYIVGGQLPLDTQLDERIAPDPLTDAIGISTGAITDYANLQTIRSSTSQALGALAKYAPALPTAVRGELFALRGYAELWLADLFCSGVPLSTLDFESDFTYKPGSTTAEVYQDAVTAFDSALALSADSARIMNLARVGLGRALLDLGRYADASAAVTDVPDGFQATLTIQWFGGGSNVLTDAATVADREGTNGLPYITGDPRTTDSVVTTNSYGFPLYFPQKYLQVLTGGGYAPFVLADWIEARLIRAEAALQAHDDATWLDELNVLRRSATVVGQTGPLPDLVDPGDTPNDSARVSMLFNERGYWLFMTGHRQGDLRRLIRQYNRPQNAVYPTGAYIPPGAALYGSDVTAAVPYSEQINPLYHGCLNRGA